MLKKIALSLAAYLAIGVGCTLYRAREFGSGRGDPGGAVLLLLIYLVAWPLGEGARFVGWIDEILARRHFRALQVEVASPPESRRLLGPFILDDAARPSYRAFMDHLARTPLTVGDKRSGHVLKQLSHAAAGADPATVLNEAEKLLAGTPSYAAAAQAAALLRGCLMREELPPADRERALALALPAYEESERQATPAERPYATLALATLYHAAGNDNSGDASWHGKARAKYEEAMAADRPVVTLPAALLAADLAADADELRLLAERVLNLADAKAPIVDAGLADGEVRFYHIRNPVLDDVLESYGLHLFPVLESGIEAAMRKSRRHNWPQPTGEVLYEFAARFAPKFPRFEDGLAMALTFVDKTLPPDREIVRVLRSGDIHCVVRQVIFRLYDDTGDDRWLAAAVASQLRLRPALKAVEAYLVGEVAFMRGDYAQHFDFSALNLIIADHPSNVDIRPIEGEFLYDRMQALQPRVKRGYSEPYYRLFAIAMSNVRDAIEREKRRDPRYRMETLDRKAMQFPDEFIFVER